MKSQLTGGINFMSFKDNDEERGMHLAGYNIEIMNNDKANEIIEELFQSLFYMYQIRLEKLIKSSNFIFDCVQLKVLDHI